MSPFDKAIAFTLAQEGGYSNDPNDSGGETNFGISKRAYPNEGIKGMTVERAAELYRRDYWDKAGCNFLPAPVAILLFDGAVNQGPVRVVRLLQAAVAVRQDGVIGPDTLRAVEKFGIRNTLSALAGKRALEYAIHPQVTLYGYGWFRRLAACLQTALQPF